MTHRIPALASLLASAVLLAACGGGGGGGNTATTPTGDGSTTVTLTGVVAKGATSGADVNVYAVTNGVVSSTAAASAAATSTTGTYSISFKPTTGQLYVVQASARSDGSTTHLDEVSNAQQALPASFKLRSFLTADGATTAIANLTPFSEAAVTVAAAASGGPTADNAAQAVSTVTQLLSFNPTAVTPTKVATASAGDQQKLAVMLAAVSQLSNSSADLTALGCTGSTIVTAGDKTACVVTQLAAAAQLKSLHLGLTVGGSSTDVSEMLGDAVQAVLSNTSINPVVNGVPAVSTSLMTPVLTNLACTGAACTAATATASSTPVATGIAAAKTFFTTIVNDWTQMFSNDGTTANSVGKVNQAGYQIRQAITDVQTPLANVFGELTAISQGDQLVRLYGNGTLSVPHSSSGSGTGSVDCGLFTDDTMSTYISQASDAATAVVACFYNAVYVYDQTTATDGYWGHLLILSQGQTADHYTYQAYAASHGYDCSTDCVPSDIQPLQLSGNSPVAWTGTIALTVDGGGNLQYASITGDMPPPILSDASGLGGDHQTWSVSDVITPSDSGDSASLTGTIKGYGTPGTDGAPLTSQLTVRSGSATFPGSAYGTNPTSVSADVLLDAYGSTGTTSPSAEVEATLTANNFVDDLHENASLPTTVTLTGALRTLTNGTATNVVTVSATSTISGFQNYDSTASGSSTNYYSLDLQATATVTAPNEPVLEFSIGGSNHLPEGDDYGLVSLQYRRLVGTTVSQVITGVASRSPTTLKWTTTLADNVDNLSVTLTESSTVAPMLMLGGSTQIGTFNTGNSVLTFTDGSFMSLALGL